MKIQAAVVLVMIALATPSATADPLPVATPEALACPQSVWSGSARRFAPTSRKGACPDAKLFINDPVATYLPALAKMPVAVMTTDASGQTNIATVTAKRGMTIQDLMRHTSGLTYGGLGDTPVHKLYPAGSSPAARMYSGSEFIEKLATLPLLH